MCHMPGRKAHNLIGQRFHRLVTIERVPNRGTSTMWKCRCDCDTIVVVHSKYLRNGRTRSCGCLRRETAAHQGRIQATHGMSKTPTYQVWGAMRSRCLNPRHPRFVDYGGRGIQVCERWDSFENFLADMGEAPTGLELDRIDNNGNYEPSNCRWATHQQQMQNRRNGRNLTHDGRTQCITAWAREVGLTRTCITNRLKRGWNIADTLRA